MFKYFSNLLASLNLYGRMLFLFHKPVEPCQRRLGVEGLGHDWDDVDHVVGVSNNLDISVRTEVDYLRHFFGDIDLVSLIDSCNVHFVLQRLER